MAHQECRVDSNDLIRIYVYIYEMHIVAINGCKWLISEGSTRQAYEWDGYHTDIVHGFLEFLA
ncbi:hypothetical protein HAX54_053103, partial [Datura stramonium]|nr:hypothetical protein [Datura stramonium]